MVEKPKMLYSVHIEYNLSIENEKVNNSVNHVVIIKYGAQWKILIGMKRKEQ